MSSSSSSSSSSSPFTIAAAAAAANPPPRRPVLVPVSKHLSEEEAQERYEFAKAAEWLDDSEREALAGKIEREIREIDLTLPVTAGLDHIRKLGRAYFKLYMLGYSQADAAPLQDVLYPLYHTQATCALLGMKDGARRLPKLAVEDDLLVHLPHYLCALILARYLGYRTAYISDVLRRSKLNQEKVGRWAAQIFAPAYFWRELTGNTGALMKVYRITHEDTAWALGRHCAPSLHYEVAQWLVFEAPLSYGLHGANTSGSAHAFVCASWRSFAALFEQDTPAYPNVDVQVDHMMNNYILATNIGCMGSVRTALEAADVEFSHAALYRLCDIGLYTLQRLIEYLCITKGAVLMPNLNLLSAIAHKCNQVGFYMDELLPFQTDSYHADTVSLIMLHMLAKTFRLISFPDVKVLDQIFTDQVCDWLITTPFVRTPEHHFGVFWKSHSLANVAARCGIDASRGHDPRVSRRAEEAVSRTYMRRTLPTFLLGLAPPANQEEEEDESNHPLVNFAQHKTFDVNLLGIIASCLGGEGAQGGFLTRSSSSSSSSRSASSRPLKRSRVD